MEFDIVIIDDKDIDLMLLSRIVKKVFPNYAPYEFLSGEEALKAIHENTSFRDTIIILLDINMPEFSGWDFLEMLNKMKSNKTIHVCIVTSSVNISDKKLAKKYPQVFDFLEKPVSLASMEKIASDETIFPKKEY